MIRGLIPATLTPFTPTGAVDHFALAEHIRHVASATGLYGIAVNGHAGEVLTLTPLERKEVIVTAKAALPPALKLIAGIEAHGLDHLVHEGLAAKAAGADMLLVIPPFDIRVYRHLARDPETVFNVFQTLEQRVGLPMIVFQYPDASGCSYSLEALRRIAELDSVVAIKASAGAPTQYVVLHDALASKVALLVASDSPSFLGMLLHDAPGALIGISVIDTPRWSTLVREATEGSAQIAKELHRDFAVPLMRSVFEYHLHWTAVCPFGATKEALRQLNQFPSAWVRPPAVVVNSAKQHEIQVTLQAIGLLN